VRSQRVDRTDVGMCIVKCTLRNDKGVSYVMVLFTIAILATLCLSFTLMTGFQREIASNYETSGEARYLARAGLNVAVWRVLNEAGFVDNNDGVPISYAIGDMSVEYMVEEAENNGSILVTSTGAVQNATTVLRHLLIPLGAATVGAGDGILLAYDTNTGGSDVIPKTRWFDGSVWTNAADTVDVGQEEVRWVDIKSCPIRDESIMGTLDNNADVNLAVRNGTSWATPWEIVNDAEASYKCFDIAYESVSGDALVVTRSGTSSILKYSTWNGTSWNPEPAGNAFDTGGGRVRFVVMEPDPSSNKILIAILDDKQDIFLYEWDGSGTFTQLPGDGPLGQIETAGTTSANKEVDIAYEQMSGDAIIVWGTSDGSYCHFRTWDGSTLSPEGDMPSFGSASKLVRLAADPASDQIMAAALDWVRDINIALWDGGTWVDQREVTTSAKDDDRLLFDLTWYDTGGTVFVAWSDDGPNKLAYFTWTSGTDLDVGTISAITPHFVGLPSIVRVFPISDSDDVLVLAVNYSSELRYSLWDGAAFTENPAPLLADSVSSITEVAFDLAVRTTPRLKYRSFTEARTDGATSIVVSTPGTNENDLLIAAVATTGDTSLSLAPPGGEGWTEIDIGEHSNDVTLGIWWKLAAATEPPSHEFTWMGEQQAYAWMMRFTGHDQADPIDVWTGDGETNSTPTSPAVTTTVDDSLILRLGAFDDDDITVDDPGLADHTAITMDASSAAGVVYESFTETKVNSAATSIAIATPGTGLVGHWKLDETSGLNATDSSGNGNDGTLTNMVGDEWTTGQIDGALEFDGNNDHIAGIGDCPTGNFTVACWAIDTGGAGWKVLYSAEQEIWFGVDSGASPKLWMDVGGNGNGANTADGTWTQDTWHHVAGTWDGTAVHLYIDGNDMPITVYGTPENPLAKAAVIGAWSKTPTDENWFGTIDDVRIYTRALGADEISQLVAGSPYSSLSEGDLLVAAVATDGDTSGSLSEPFGEGWIQLDVSDYINEVTLGAWWKLADADESPSHQFTWSGGQQAYGWMMHFTGHDPSDPIDAYAAAGESSSTPTSPSVSTTVEDAIILRLGAFDDSDITEDDPGLIGHTAITMDASGSSGQVIYHDDVEEARRTSGAQSLTISTPAGTSENDLLIAAVVTDSNETISTPGGEGWVEIAHDTNSVTLGVWWKLADASESASHQFTWGSNEEAYGWIMRFTGHNQADPIDVSGTNGGNAWTPDCPAVTTAVANTMILRIGGFDDDDVNVDVTGLSGYTDITMDESSGGNGTCSGGAGYVQQPAIGDTGIAEFQLTSSEQYRTVTIAIAPAMVAGGPVSGGAGYVAQSSIGASGTSDFALTASQETQMLTIAIAPDPNGGPVSGGAGYVEQPSSGDSGTSTFSLTASEEARTVTIAIAPAGG